MINRSILLSIVTCILLAAGVSLGNGGVDTDTNSFGNGLRPVAMIPERPPLSGRLPADLLPLE